MDNQDNNNIIQKESIKILSTPKFIKNQMDKDNLSNNNSMNYDISSFDESKNEAKKNYSKNAKDSLLNNEDIKESNDNFLFKENFSLLSLFNNSSSNKINQDKEQNDKNDKNDNALISFCDKSENNSFNNEIIFKDKNNSSIITNKDKEKEEKDNLKINSFNNSIQNNILIKEEINENLGGNKDLNLNQEKNKEKPINSIEINNLNQKHNDSSSFNYNLPLEGDKISTISGLFEDNNIELLNKIANTNKTLDLENHNLDLKTININIKRNKFNIKTNNILLKKYNITYSKKKVKRKSYERLNKTYKNSPAAHKKNNSIEIRKNKSFIEKGINKITIKKNILNSCANYKIKKKMKKKEINSSNKENKENKELFLTERANYNTISPKKKLRIVINKAKINLNLDNIDNLNNINNINNCFSSRENIPKISKNLELQNNIHSSNKIVIEKNTKYRKKNNNSFSTKQKNSRNNKLIKSSFEFNNTLFNFKTKKYLPNIETNFNLHNTKELNDYNQDMDISGIVKNEKNLGIYTKSNKKLLTNKKYNNRNRNISNLYSNKIFNGIKGLLKNNNIIFNTINYVNNDSKNHIQRKNYLNNKINPKIEIKSSLLPLKKPINKKFKIPNKLINKDLKKFYLKNNNKSNNIEQANKDIFNIKDKNKNKFHKKTNKNIINRTINKTTYNRPNNLVFNHKESNSKKLNHNINDYNSISHYNTYRNFSGKNIISNKNNNNNFVNINCSANSLKTNKIKVKMANKPKKETVSPGLSYINKKNNYWKIYKKPKNCCLLNKFSNDFNRTEYNLNYDKTNLGNSQFIKFKENKVINNNFTEENNSSSITNDFFNSQKTDLSNTITSNYLNVEQINQDLNSTHHLKRKKIYQNSDKINKKNNSCYRNKSNEISEIFSLEKNINNFDICNKFSLNEDIIKFTILRNNLNNKIIKEFLVVVGDEKNKNSNLKEIKDLEIRKNNNRENNINNDNKKTIINVNQYYPSYFIK